MVSLLRQLAMAGSRVFILAGHHAVFGKSLASFVQQIFGPWFVALCYSSSVSFFAPVQFSQPAILSTELLGRQIISHAMMLELACVATQIIAIHVLQKDFAPQLL